MTTAEAIEGITDPGKFEILALQVLRVLDNDCRFLVHMGVNAEGQTIKNPLDAFCKIPGSSPPRFVKAMFTITDPKKIKHKWLNDSTEKDTKPGRSRISDGEIIVAGKSAVEIRTSYPDAQFVLHLCWNWPLEKDLMVEAYKAGSDLGLEVVFLEQSRIRDCLDTTPEGQWLRMKHLGIEAELVSLPLLADLSQKSLQLYQREFSFTAPDDFVTSEVSRKLASSGKSEAFNLHLLVGRSGFGKSVASYQLLRDHINRGGIGIWVPGQIANKAISLEEALTSTLRVLFPKIQKDAGIVSLGFATHQERFLFVVDDINRGHNPVETIKKVMTWAKPINSNASEGEAVDGLARSLVLPVWDSTWNAAEMAYNRSPWLNQIPVGPMHQDDAVQCLRAALHEKVVDFQEWDLQSSVDALGYDPTLISIFATIIRDDNSQNPLRLCHKVIERYTSSITKELATSGEYLSNEYQSALQILVANMLNFRELSPAWETVSDWLPDRQLQIVRKLAIDGTLCRIVEYSHESYLEFRHDRILEHYLSCALVELLKDPHKSVDILSDPYYSSFIGSALAGSIGDTSQVASWLKKHNPIALFAAIRLLDQNVSFTGDDIVTNAKKWLTEALASDNKPPEAYQCCRHLEKAESPLVLEITEVFRTHYFVANARLVNGDALGAITWLSRRGEFWPSVRDPFFESILERGVYRHGSDLIEQLKTILEDDNLAKNGLAYGALSLAGYIASDKLATSIKKAWDSIPEKLDILVPAIWSAIRCGASNSEALLTPMLKFWSSLPDDDTNEKLSKRSEVAQTLSFALRHGVREPVLGQLIGMASDNKLDKNIAWMLEELDHPNAIVFTIRVISEMVYQAEQQGSFLPWEMILMNKWDPTQLNGRSLSATSLEAVQLIWQSAKNSTWLRKGAFNFWVTAAQDIATLQIVEPEHAGFTSALWRRAKLGDLTTIPHVKEFLRSDKKWFRVISHIWSTEFIQDIDEALANLHDTAPSDFSKEETSNHYMLSRVLRDVDPSVAEKLLIKHWAYLRYSRSFLQLALYLGTNATLGLAEAILNDCPAELDVLKGLGSFFGFMTHGLRQKLSIKNLEVLQPYIARIPSLTLIDIANFCNSDCRSWASLHLRREFDRRRADPSTNGEDAEFIENMGKHLFPSDSDLSEALDEIERQENRLGSVWMWCDKFELQQDGSQRWRTILDQWLAINPSMLRLEIVGEIISRLGNRKDLALLTKYPVDADLENLNRLCSRIGFLVKIRSLK